MFSQYRGLRREIYVLSFGRLVTNLGAMIWPMMTLILNQKMGMSAGQISILLAAAGILMLPVNLLGGKLADRYNKKNILIVCDLVSIVCYVICSCIPLSVPVLVLIFTAAVGQSMEHPTFNALIADLSKSEDRERAYSIQYLAANLGLVLAPTIAGFLFRDFLWLSFLISGLSIASSTVLIYFFVRDITPEEETGAAGFYQENRREDSLRQILRERPILLLHVFLFGMYSAVYMQFNYLMPLDLGRIHGADGALIFGTITSVNCITVVVFTPLITRWSVRLREVHKIFCGDAMILSGYVIFLLFAGRIPFYYVSMTVFTWGEIFRMLGDNPYVTRRVPASHRGRINGLTAVVQAVLTGAGQLLVGRVYDHAGPGPAWACVLAMGSLSVMLICVLILRDRKVFPELYEARQ